jgi:hypothetical protein
VAEILGTRPPLRQRNDLIYLWLVLSYLGSVASISSIVDGLVQWVNFFRDFLDIYHTWIREPISWAVHLVWPTSWFPLPPWVFDLFVVWSAFWVAFNIDCLRFEGGTFWKWAWEDYGPDFEYRGIPSLFVIILIFYWIVLFLSLPVVTICAAFPDNRLRAICRQTMKTFFFLVASVVALAFLNWQLRHVSWYTLHSVAQ